MIKNKTIISTNNSKLIEDVRIGYQSAINLWTYEGAQNWERFNIMLVANSIIIATLGLIITSNSIIKKLSIIFIILSLFGIILCFLWLFITRRGFDYQKYYIMSARQFEEFLPSNKVRTASNGAIFSEGKEVRFKFNNKITKLKMGFFSNIASAGKMAIIVILLFLFLYLMIITLSIINIFIKFL